MHNKHVALCLGHFIYTYGACSSSAYFNLTNDIFEFGIKNVFKIRLYVINLVTL